MTRDEAAKIWDESPTDFWEPVHIIDKFVRLGILKLEEPKSVNERAWEVLSGFTADPCVIDCLHRAGLKIVEK